MENQFHNIGYTSTRHRNVASMCNFKFEKQDNVYITSQMVKVSGDVKCIGKQFTVDCEVETDHSYQIDVDTKVISHNSVSLLAGATPGVHFPISRHYIRRVRLMNSSWLIPALEAAGLKIEPDVNNEKTTVVVEFPISIGDNVRTQSEVSVWEKVRLAEFIQRYWADNQVSVTIDFDPETESNDIKSILDYSQESLKSISFLPRSTNSYPQMPYEAITEEQYNEMVSRIKPLVFDADFKTEEVEKELDVFCDGDSCTIVRKTT